MNNKIVYKQTKDISSIYNSLIARSKKQEIPLSLRRLKPPLLADEAFMEIINTSHKETNELFDKYVTIEKKVVLPSIEEFKMFAKKLKNLGIFKSVCMAQNALAKEFGYKEYRAIKDRLKTSEA
jgi:hypothetical protein